jgi:hypothetical protein
MAIQAIHQAPGVLAVSVDYQKQQAIIGTEPNRPVPKDEILTSLESIGYSGEFVE